MQHGYWHIYQLFHSHRSLRQQQYLVNTDPVLVNSASRTENVYEPLKGEIDSKSALENSLCAEMATTNIDYEDPEGTYEYIKNN